MKKFILPLICVFLAAAYFFSFLNFNSDSKKEIWLSDQIDEITVHKGAGNLVLFNENALWKGLSENIVFPVEQELVLSLCSDLLKPFSVKNEGSFSSEDMKKNNLTENEGLFVSLKNQKEHKNFILGASDFSGTGRFCIFTENYSEKNPEIYRIYGNFENLFHTESRFWIDPYFIPENLFYPECKTVALLKVKSGNKNFSIIPGKSVIQEGTKTDVMEKLLELRHGALYTGKDLTESVMELSAEYENQRNITVKIFPYSETDFVVSYNLEKNGIQEFHYSVFISSWTFSTVKKLLGL